MTKFKKIIMVFVVLLLLGGCSSPYIQDSNKKNITYEKTGQTLPNNILCKPQDKELLKLYEEHNDQLKISIKKLPSCNNFKVNSTKSTGIWEGIFVKPLAYLIIKLTKLVKNYGISVIILSILIRLILLPFAKKTQMQSLNMKKINPEIEAIERKYRDRTDNDAMMAKAQETMMVYKKYNINPLSSCLVTFIQLPVFLAFYQALQRIPAIYEEHLFGMYLGTTPLVGIKAGHYVYLVLVILVFLTTYYSFKKVMVSSGNKEQDDQMKFMLIFMLVFIGMASFSLSTAIGIYWVTTNGFVAIQNAVISKMIEKQDTSIKKGKKNNKKLTIKEKANRKK